MLRESKPKNARSSRALSKRAPLINENPKKVLFLRSTSSSSLVNSIVSDLYSLKRPLAIRFTKKNNVYPFEDPSSLEFFSQKNDASLLCFSSHSKKRPHCLTFVRCFGGKVLDMLECRVVQDTARTLSQFGGSKCRVGTKPLLSFSGAPFEELSSGERSKCKSALAKSMFLDFFRGEEAKEVDVEGLQMMITFVAIEEENSEGQASCVVHMRVWKIVTKKSGQKLPRVEVEEMGPRIDFCLGRVQEPDDEMLKESLKRSKTSETKSKKNVETDIMGDKTGRIHLGRQELNELQTRKMKGLKRVRGGRDEADDEEQVEASAGSDIMAGEEVFGGSSDDELDQKRPRLA